MDKKELYSKLVTYLEDELKVYRHLLDLVRKEKEILIAANIDDLNENNKSKEVMLAKVRQLDRVREKAAREMAQAVGADMAQPRLLDIASRLETAEGDRLRSIHQAFEMVVGRLKDLNKKNESLAQTALANVQGAMNAIKTTLGETPVYKKQGDMKKTEVQSGQFVSKEA